MEGYTTDDEAIKLNGSQLAKIWKSIPDMSLP